MTNENNDRLEFILSNPPEPPYVDNEDDFILLIQEVRRLTLENKNLRTFRYAKNPLDEASDFIERQAQVNASIEGRGDLDGIPKYIPANLYMKQIESLTAENEELRKWIDPLGPQKVKDLTKERDELRASCKRKDENVDYQIIEKEKLKKENASIAKERDNQCSLKQNLIGRVEELRAKRVELSLQIDSLRKERNDYQCHAESSSEIIRDLEAELAKLKG